MENEIENPLKPDWGKIIEEQERSGLSQAEFCRQHELEPSKFSYYRGRIKVKKPQRDSKSAFQAVKISSANINDEIKLLLPNGFQCLFSSQIDVMQVKKLVEILLSC